MWKRIVLIFSLCAAVLSAGAQSGMSVDSVFGDYGRRRGATLIDLASDVLGSHTRIDRYKCLIIEFSPETAKRLEQSVRRDYAACTSDGNGIIVKEISKNGMLQSATYALERDASSSVTEYILYSCSNDKITLVYLNGRFKPDRLKDELDRLKDLFIKVNNKQIKLY